MICARYCDVQFILWLRNVGYYIISAERHGEGIITRHLLGLLHFEFPEEFL